MNSMEEMVSKSNAQRQAEWRARQVEEKRSAKARAELAGHSLLSIAAVIVRNSGQLYVEWPRGSGRYQPFTVIDGEEEKSPLKGS